MKNNNILIALSLFSLLAACGGPGDSADVPDAQPAGAPNVDIGDHVVHFSALATDQLPPDVARVIEIDSTGGGWLLFQGRCLTCLSLLVRSPPT